LLKKWRPNDWSNIFQKKMRPTPKNIARLANFRPIWSHYCFMLWTPGSDHAAAENDDVGVTSGRRHGAARDRHVVREPDGFQRQHRREVLGTFRKKLN
jgi:hypothetical protein